MTTHQRHRLAVVRRTFIAAAAAFAAILVLLGAQLALGRDPALRARASTQTAAAQRPAEDPSIVGTILGVARAALADGEHEGGDAAPSVQTRSS